jgi:hypothetical protein
MSVALLALAALGLVKGGRLSVVDLAASPRPLAGGPGLSVLATLLACAAGACAISAVNNVRYVAIDADNMFYHLPFVAEWVRTGSIWPSEAIPHVQRGFPASREAVHAFLSVPLRGEHLALTAVLERPYFGLVCYALARRLQAGVVLATALAACAATIPTAEPIGNDPWLGTMFALAGLYLLAMRGRPAAILGGLALGCLASTKFSGVVYSGIIGATYVALTVWRGRGAAGRPAALRPLQDLGIACLATTLIALPVAFRWVPR